MPFSSLLFLSGFLPAFLALYWIAPRIAKNGVALAFSLIFYAWGAPRLLPVVLALGVIDFYLGRVVADANARGEKKKAKRIVIAGVALHLSVLAYFKYSNFLVGQTNDLLTLLPHGAKIAWTEVPLPIGISFLTFEEISYLVDVYRGDAKPPRSVFRYLLFLMLFPHSIAGPIFRWKDLEAQLADRKHTLDTIADGFGRFTLGLAKKVLIADAAAMAVDPIFALDVSKIDFRLAWIATAAYTLQIYFDFSGYSDMAIGLGKMAGFKFKENFDAPYGSASITEFWKRWHISLSTWLRDYLYVPLGGNRHGERRTRINMMIVFGLSGLWHGAAWTFVVWGIFHGILSVLERTEHVKKLRAALPGVLNVALTLLLVAIGWVFFRAPSMKSALVVLRAMSGLGAHVDPPPLLDGQILSRRSILMLALGAIIVVLPRALGPTVSQRLTLRWRPLALTLVPLLLILSMAQLANTDFVPLIYFKF